MTATTTKTDMGEVGNRGGGAGGGGLVLTVSVDARDPVTRPSARTKRALAEGEERRATKRAKLERTIASVLLLVVIALGLGFVAACFSGCTTIPSTSVDQLRLEVSVGRANIAKWKTLSDDDKLHAYFNQVRAQKDVLHASAGDPMEEFASSPWDKSAAPASSDAITTPKCPDDDVGRLPCFRDDELGYFTFPEPGVVCWNLRPGVRGQ